LLAQLKRHEGLRLKPYTDTTGHLSIGYGRNLADVGISEAEAHLLLENDIDRTWSALTTALPWVQSLDVVRQTVLVNMAFNLGLKGLLKFKTTLGHVQAGSYVQASEAMLKSQWTRQVGARARELAAAMHTGSFLTT